MTSNNSGVDSIIPFYSSILTHFTPIDILIPPYPFVQPRQDDDERDERGDYEGIFGEEVAQEGAGQTRMAETILRVGIGDVQ